MKTKFSPKTLAMLEASKHIKKAYGLNRNLTESEIIAEVKNMLRREENGTMDDFYETLFSKMEKKSWELVIKNG